MTELGATISTRISATPDEVWKALTTPDLIKQWFFGVDTETDWKVGSQLVHRGVYQGKPYVDKGEILRFDPAKLLVHTHWTDVSGKPDRPEYYQEVAWALSKRDGATELTHHRAKSALRGGPGDIGSKLEVRKELLERRR